MLAHNRKLMQMAEPTSSGVASYAVYKLAVVYGLPAGLAAVIVMLMTKPRSPTEWALSLISTVSSSIYGGAFAARYFGWHRWAFEQDGLIMLGGLYLVCGLPAWVVIRALFAWADRRKDKDLAELAKDARQAFDDVRGGGK